MTNSTITNASTSVYLDRDSHLVARNTTFDKATTLFNDPLSTLAVDWFLDVRTEDVAGRPLPGAAIEVRNVTGTLVGAGPTDAAGAARWFPAREYVQRDLNGDGDGSDPGEIAYETPHNVTATFQGMTAYASPEPVMDVSKEVVLTFPATLETVTVTRSPEAGQVLVDGVPYDAPATFSWLSGTVHTIEAPAIEEYAPGSRYAFEAWSDGGVRTHTVTVPAGGAVYVASYRVQHLASASVSGTDGHSVPVTYVANGTPATGSAGPSWSEWVDEGSTVQLAAEADGGTPVERWATANPLAGPPWSPVTASFSIDVVYVHQFRLQLSITGLPPSTPAELAFRSFGTPRTASSPTTFDEWADAGSSASVPDVLAVAARERYRTTDVRSWSVAAPVDASVGYVRQFSHAATLLGTDADHMVTVSFVLDGQARMETIFGNWSGWSDTGTSLTVSQRTSGDPPRLAEGATSWTVDAPLDLVVRYAEAGPPPPPETNLKPLVAAAFSVGLAVAGLLSARRTPWKGHAGRRGTLLAFATISLPFVILETATGIVSAATGLLGIPPLLGVGTAVDVSILVAGIAAGLVYIRHGRTPK